MRASSRVIVLVERRAVEARQGELVAREVRGHPVEDDAEPLRVQGVDEGAEVVGCAEARRRREEPRHLVAPRARERVLHDRHQLDVREVEVAHVVGELVGELQVVQRAVFLERIATPRAEVHLIDRDRPLERLGRAAPLEPLVVGPLVARRVHDRGVRRRHLRRERERIGLDPQPAVLRADLELVLLAVLDSRDEELPDPGRAKRTHRVQAPVPRVEVADDRHRARVGRPDGERRADRAVDLAHVRAEPLVELLVPALHDEVHVEVAERRQERVRIAQRERRAACVLDL